MSTVNAYPDRFVVCVRCNTYNHASYIKDAMDGFAMQQTSFPFVAIIIDDASTDGEQDVLLQYLCEHFLLTGYSGAQQWETDEARFIFARHNANEQCWFAVVLLKHNYYQQKKSKESLIAQWCKGTKYTAICEGDDYWTEPDKLQQQVDFLESHPNYTMCFHDVDIKAEAGRSWYNVFRKLENRDYTGLENLLRWSVPTCSMMMVTDVFDTRPSNPRFTMGDNVWVLTCSRKGLIRCINKKMGVYRLTPTSWIGSQGDKQQRYKYISHYHGLIEEFEECRCKPMYRILEEQYFQLLTILKKKGDKKEFARVKQEYLTTYPGLPRWKYFYIHFYKNQLRCFVKRLLGENIVSIVRKIKKT